MNFLIFNANILVAGGEVIKEGSILVKDGRIAKIGRKPASGLPCQRLIDANGCFAAPGFIDLQVYGDPERIACHEAMFGTTGFLATIPCSSRKATAKKVDSAVNDAGRQAGGARMLGINLEGPYLNRAKPGAQDKRSARKPDSPELRDLVRRSKGCLKFMTTAPELKGAAEAIKTLKSKGVIPSIGHTKATFEEVENAADLGANCATHVFNAMDEFRHREPGAIDAILEDHRISATAILDGEHISPQAFRILLKCKGKEKVILITDSLRNDSSFDAKWDGGVYRLKDGTIAGSGLTMINAVMNAVRFGDLSVAEAVGLASGNPAKLLGLGRKGAIRPGNDADIVLFDNRFDVWLTMAEGRIIYKKCAA
ncbi:MAG: N-acetylglucosamine-6-phosphate deacetylase [Candidatus Omnitrophica bacterium]|nr:N-acetylglucosamine-6-phosphate deacetylase [Candidatus Omnitrophota bacterium]MDD5737755.1 N-acetylglucosamine-6-phosphate deacetylase [Candidatus Omnitrophota bacterium]